MSLNRHPIMRPEFLPLSILRAIWRGKFLALAVFAVVCVGTYFYVQRVPALYRTEALITVDSQKIPDDYVNTTVRTNVQDRLQSISRQILSTERLKKLIVDMELYPGLGKNVPDVVAEAMRKEITITIDKSTFTGGMTAFRVGFVANHPKVVADVTNRLAAFFVEENLKDREVLAQGTSEFIGSQLKDAKQKLDSLESQVTEYKMRHSGELPQQQNALLSSMGRLQSELQANSSSIERVRQNKVVLEGSLDLAEATLENAKRNWESSQRLAQMQAQAQAQAAAAAANSSSSAVPVPVAVATGNPEIEKLQATLAELRIRYSDEHPDVKRARFRLERMQAVEREKEAALAAVTPTPTPTRTTPAGEPAPRVTRAAAPASREPIELLQARERVQNLKAQIGAAGKEIDARNADERRLRQEMSGLQAHIDRLPVREQEMAQIVRDLEISRAAYTGLLGKKMSADMATDLEKRQKAERFTIVDPAPVPLGPFKPNRKLMLLMGCGFGLLLGIALAFLNEMRRNVLLGEWEFPPNTVILGTLPRIEIDATRTNESVTAKV